MWPKMARLRPHFGHQKSPRKSLCGSLFAFFPRKWGTSTFFLGAQKGGFWVGAKKFMLKKFMCFFPSSSVAACLCYLCCPYTSNIQLTVCTHFLCKIPLFLFKKPMSPSGSKGFLQPHVFLLNCSAKRSPFFLQNPWALRIQGFLFLSSPCLTSRVKKQKLS